MGRAMSIPEALTCSTYSCASSRRACGSSSALVAPLFWNHYNPCGPASYSHNHPADGKGHIRCGITASAHSGKSHRSGRPWEKPGMAVSTGTRQLLVNARWWVGIKLSAQFEQYPGAKLGLGLLWLGVCRNRWKAGSASLRNYWQNFSHWWYTLGAHRGCRRMLIYRRKQMPASSVPQQWLHLYQVPTR